MAETLTARLKDTAWGGLEVGALIAGAVVTTKFLDEHKVFKDEFTAHPEWFDGNRDGAPFKIKYFPGMVAGGALFASTYIRNPWVKLALMGVAFAGGVKQLRILTWDKDKSKFRFERIGAEGQDAELKALAEEYRAKMNGPEYVSRPEYVEGQNNFGDRYESAIAAYGGVKPETTFADRYESAIAKGLYDEDEDVSIHAPFNFHGSDTTDIG
jgi:hypothetical protein